MQLVGGIRSPAESFTNITAAPTRQPAKVSTNGSHLTSGQNSRGSMHEIQSR
jgi:hypothetical protein